MIASEDLETLIRRHILLGKKSRKGYEVVKCALCNDYQARGGFKFEGETVHYHCFNCSTSTGYDPEYSRHTVSDKFKEVLTSFGISEEEINHCVSFNFFKKPVPSSTPNERRGPGYPTKECPLPDISVKVSSGSSEWCMIAEQYLAKRSLSSKDYDFYVSEDQNYVGRLLIPYFFRNKVIYWQGRSLDAELVTPRYKNPVLEKENIFFNMDELYRNTTEPLFITEGALDAVSVGKTGVALSGSTLSDFQTFELRKVSQRRKVVFVIDKNLNGWKLGQNVLSDTESKFYVTCFPDNIEDSNDALKKYGRLWLASYLSSSAKSGFEGKVLLELYCSK